MHEIDAKRSCVVSSLGQRRYPFLPCAQRDWFATTVKRFETGTTREPLVPSAVRSSGHEANFRLLATREIQKFLPSPEYDDDDVTQYSGSSH